MKVLADLSTDDFFGRTRELETFGGHAHRQDGRNALLLLSAPGTERSQFLKHAFDRLFTGQGDIIPFYFSVSERDKNARQIAGRFVYEFLLQTVAFRRSDPKILYSSPGILELAELAAPEDAHWIDRIVDSLSHETADESMFLRTCLGAPHRAAAEGAKPFVMIDSLHRLAHLDEGEEIIGAVREGFAHSEAPFVLAGNRRYLSGRVDGEVVHLQPLTFEDAGLLIEKLAAENSVQLNEQARDLIAVQLDGNRAFITSIILAARKSGKSLESFQSVQQVYAEELFSGTIGRFYDDLFRKVIPGTSDRNAILSILHNADENHTVADWQSSLGCTESEISRILNLLNINEILRLSSSHVEATSDNHLLTDYLLARFRLDVSGEARALVYAESLAEFLKRASRAMAESYRSVASLDVRKIMDRFDARQIPLGLIDYGLFAGRYKGLDDNEILNAMQGDPDTLHLPRIVLTAYASTIYKPLDQVAAGPRSAVALGFQGDNFTDESEIVWIAAEIDSKLEASRELAEFWCDRLEMVAIHSNFSNYSLWLISPEGFTPDALDVLKQRNCFGSSARQARLLARFLSAEPESSARRNGNVYELVLPMDGETELIAAHAVEEIAKRHNFEPSAINQIKTALVEACINASEHSLSPDRRLRQRIVAADDRITITVSNRGLRLTDRPADTNSNETRRGWGLKLIEKLMDEVTINPTDDGTSITMTKFR